MNIVGNIKDVKPRAERHCANCGHIIDKGDTVKSFTIRTSSSHITSVYLHEYCYLAHEDDIRIGNFELEIDSDGIEILVFPVHTKKSWWIKFLDFLGYE